MGPNHAAINDQLEAILASPGFSSAPRMRAFLRYLADVSLDGKGAHLKGYTIGVDVFDRDVSFDPGTDPIVRVQAGRLRTILKEYYYTIGSDDPVRIDIPKGGYEVKFSDNAPALTPTTGVSSTHKKLKATGSTFKKAGLSAMSGRLALIMIGAASLLTLFIVSGMSWWHPTPPQIKITKVRGLEIMFFERPPYHVQEGSRGVMGIFANRVSKTMEQAGIDFTWTFKPASWHLQELKKNDRPMCISGWFKTPVRQQYSKYTESIYRDSQFVVLTRTDNNNVLRHKTLKSLIEDAKLSFGSKQTFSYGTQFDKMLSKAKTIVVSTSIDSVGMLKILIDGTFDYTLVDREEAEELSRQATGLRAKIISIQLSDMPPAQGRYLACTQKVDDALINKINQAVKTLGFHKK